MKKIILALLFGLTAQAHGGGSNSGVIVAGDSSNFHARSIRYGDIIVGEKTVPTNEWCNVDSSQGCGEKTEFVHATGVEVAVKYNSWQDGQSAYDGDGTANNQMIQTESAETLIHLSADKVPSDILRLIQNDKNLNKPGSALNRKFVSEHVTLNVTPVTVQTQELVDLCYNPYNGDPYCPGTNFQYVPGVAKVFSVEAMVK